MSKYIHIFKFSRALFMSVLSCLWSFFLLRFPSAFTFLFFPFLPLAVKILQGSTEYHKRNSFSSALTILPMKFCFPNTEISMILLERVLYPIPWQSSQNQSQWDFCFRSCLKIFVASFPFAFLKEFQPNAFLRMFFQST